MNRSIEIRLKRLEDASTPVTSPRRSHVIGLEAGQDREAREAAKAELIASGAADPDDFFWFLLPLEPDPTSAFIDSEMAKTHP